ncbi:transcriptional regulator GcvA [Pigmentiphaga soli]|uniref:Transcriptional regulator GcvA n=1 Tax=Pigmentiphaga soli TaxID=1007095 RepID=A0ABP8GGH3_9BURK
MDTPPSRIRSALPPLHPLRIFESVAHHLSFTAAARELHITQGAVSQQIKALESWLGFELFERRGRGVALARGGQEYAAVLSAAFLRIAHATEDLVATRSHQVLTVRGHTTFFLRWLIPRLPAFQAAHPEIKVRLSAHVEPVDFRVDSADVGIVYGGAEWPGTTADLLFSDELTPVLSPRLAATLDPGDPDALLALPLLHSTRRPRHWGDWIAAAGAARPAGAPDMYYEDLSVVYQCAIEGLGVALGQLRYLRREIARGTLVAPHPVVLRRAAGYYLLCPHEAADDRKVTVFRRWLLDEAVRMPDL